MEHSSWPHSLWIQEFEQRFIVVVVQSGNHPHVFGNRSADSRRDIARPLVATVAVLLEYLLPSYFQTGDVSLWRRFLRLWMLLRWSADGCGPRAKQQATQNCY